MNIQELSNLTQPPRDDYYELLLSHSTTIINEVGRTSQAKVAKLLHISPPKFSGVFGCIVAYDNLKVD